MARIYEDGDSFELYGGKQLAEIVEKNIEWYKHRYETAIEKAARDKEVVRAEVVNEYAADNQRLHAALDLSYGEFSYPEEMERYKEFCKEHEPCRTTMKMNYGKIPYVIATGTGIGTGFDVICPVCGVKKDITEFTKW